MNATRAALRKIHEQGNASVSTVFFLFFLSVLYRAHYAKTANYNVQLVLSLWLWLPLSIMRYVQTRISVAFYAHRRSLRRSRFSASPVCHPVLLLSGKRGANCVVHLLAQSGSTSQCWSPIYWLFQCKSRSVQGPILSSLLRNKAFALRWKEKGLGSCLVWHLSLEFFFVGQFGVVIIN
jgi:hypothetical protein